MTINSRAKGARGERELADYLRSYGIEARRGQQFSGSPDSPDVITSLPHVHFECKRVERGSIYPWLAQAVRDSRKDQIPVVAHRRNGEDWIAILPLGYLLELLNGRPADMRLVPEGVAANPAEGLCVDPIGVVVAKRRRASRRGMLR